MQIRGCKTKRSKVKVENKREDFPRGWNISEILQVYTEPKGQQRGEGKGTGKRVSEPLSDTEGRVQGRLGCPNVCNPKVESASRWGHPIRELSVNHLSSFSSGTEVFTFTLLPLPSSLSLWEFLMVYICFAFMWKWVRKQKGKLFLFPIAFWEGNEVDMEWVPPHLYHDFLFKL